ncbi:helix-turn-helix transcriptional regulator [bacterium]|nr:helix-turn-helix transcriptional regulator [bacterium]
MYQDKDLLIQLGRNIKAERVRRGYTQEVFAEKIGFTREYISRIERGQENMSILKINNLANVLEVEINNILKF